MIAVHLKFRFFISCILLFISIAGSAQKENAEFRQLAHLTDSVCMKAYYIRDSNAYKKQLSLFLKKYDKLDSSGKKEFMQDLNGAYYNLCCLYSLQNVKSKALEYFRKSYEAEYYNYTHILGDSDLNNIRNEIEFKIIANKMRQIGDYLYILKNASKYNRADSRQLPAFTYQSKDNPNLVELRKSFKLDSVAGKGNDISKVISMLHFIHNLIPHDGSHENPTVKNAMAMIAICKKDNRGLNCRGLATVLNECYLSMGFKSRIVTCLPKDSMQIDPDCHVINSVYLPSLKKWVWMDPTFDAYVMNETGELLSIEEVRERLIAGKTLLINPDANWNHKSSQNEKYYLEYYMAKNLYMLECPVNSEYNMETREDGKTISYIKLLPLEYYKQTPAIDKNTIKSSNTTYVVYKTNNPAAFWETP